MGTGQGSHGPGFPIVPDNKKLPTPLVEQQICRQNAENPSRFFLQ